MPGLEALHEGWMVTGRRRSELGQENYSDVRRVPNRRVSGRSLGVESGGKILNSAILGPDPPDRLVGSIPLEKDEGVGSAVLERADARPAHSAYRSFPIP